MYSKIFVVIGALLLHSCASSHNLADGRGPFGGGYEVVKVSQHKYKITAITNWAPWPNYDSVRDKGVRTRFAHFPSLHLQF